MREKYKYTTTDEALLRWLESQGVQKGDMHDFYPLGAGKNDERFVLHVTQMGTVEFIFESQHVSLFDQIVGPLKQRSDAASLPSKESLDAEYGRDPR